MCCTWLLKCQIYWSRLSLDMGISPWQRFQLSKARACSVLQLSTYFLHFDLSRFRNLQSLAVPTWEFARAQVANMAELRAVNLYATRSSADLRACIPNLLMLPKLDTLRIAAGPANDEWRRAEVQVISSLSHKLVDLATESEVSTILNVVAACTHLTTLKLNCRGVVEWAELRGLSHLQTLELWLLETRGHCYSALMRLPEQVRHVNVRYVALVTLVTLVASSGIATAKLPPLVEQLTWTDSFSPLGFDLERSDLTRLVKVKLACRLTRGAAEALSKGPNVQDVEVAVADDKDKGVILDLLLAMHVAKLRVQGYAGVVVKPVFEASVESAIPSISFVFFRFQAHFAANVKFCSAVDFLACDFGRLLTLVSEEIFALTPRLLEVRFKSCNCSREQFEVFSRCGRL